MKIGSLVRIIKSPVGFNLAVGDTGIVIRNGERYWDFGGGDCGFVNVAEVLIRGEIAEIAHQMLEEVPQD